MGSRKAQDRAGAPPVSALASDPTDALRDQLDAQSSIRMSNILQAMEEIVAQHRRVPRSSSTDVHSIGITLDPEISKYLAGEVRRRNKVEGRKLGAAITKTDLYQEILRFRIPDLSLYEAFAEIVQERRRVFGRVDSNARVPLALAEEIYDLGVSVPNRTKALSPKAVAEALIYAWATTVNTANLFKPKNMGKAFSSRKK